MASSQINPLYDQCAESREFSVRGGRSAAASAEAARSPFEVSHRMHAPSRRVSADPGGHEPHACDTQRNCTQSRRVSEEGQSDHASSLSSRPLDDGPRHAWNWAALNAAVGMGDDDGAAAVTPMSNTLLAGTAVPNPPSHRNMSGFEHRTSESLTSGFYTAGSDEMADPSTMSFLQHSS